MLRGQGILDHARSETDRLVQQEEHNIAMRALQKENVANNKK